MSIEENGMPAISVWPSSGTALGEYLDQSKHGWNLVFMRLKDLVETAKVSYHGKSHLNKLFIQQAISIIDCCINILFFLIQQKSSITKHSEINANEISNSMGVQTPADQYAVDPKVPVDL